MTATLDRDQIRARIDALECLDDVQQAIDDVGSVEWEAHETPALDVQIGANEAGVSFVNNIPPSVLLAGLQAMERELAKLAGAEGAGMSTGPYLCVMPACGPDCCGCNHAISPAQARHNAVRYEWLRSIGREQLEAVMHNAGPALDAAIDKELEKLAKATRQEWFEGESDDGEPA